MITLKDFMEVVDYRITEGSEYGWRCFGSEAYCLDSWNGEHDGYTVSVVFDRLDQTVYQAEAHDYLRQRAYRLTNPNYKTAREQEARALGADDREAWDDVRFVELETSEDFLEKVRAIVAGEDYDTRVVIPVDLPDDVLFTLMRRAHEQDITLNQLFERIMRDAIDRHRQENPQLWSGFLSEDEDDVDEDVSVTTRGKM